MAGFRKFLLRGNVVDLAIGVIIGAAFAMVVAALTADLLTPLIAAIIGKPNFSDLYFTLHKSKFMYGSFVNAIITFVITAAVIYFFVVIPVGKMLQRYQPTPDEPTPMKDCVDCLSSIPAAASRCAFCTVEQPEVPATA